MINGKLQAGRRASTVQSLQAGDDLAAMWEDWTGTSSPKPNHPTRSFVSKPFCRVGTGGAMADAMEQDVADPALQTVQELLRNTMVVDLCKPHQKASPIGARGLRLAPLRHPNATRACASPSRPALPGLPALEDSDQGENRSVSGQGGAKRPPCPPCQRWPRPTPLCRQSALPHRGPFFLVQTGGAAGAQHDDRRRAQGTYLYTWGLQLRLLGGGRAPPRCEQQPGGERAAAPCHLRVGVAAQA